MLSAETASITFDSIAFANSNLHADNDGCIMIHHQERAHLSYPGLLGSYALTKCASRISP